MARSSFIWYLQLVIINIKFFFSGSTLLRMLSETFFTDRSVLCHTILETRYD